MSINDPIADMLTRIRNAIQAGHATVEIPASHIKEKICAVLKREGYVQGYTLKERGVQGVLEVTLRYTPERVPVVQGIRRISTPSLRVYVRSREIRLVRSGLGISVVSTSEGIMTGKQARRARLGGEVICEVW